MIKCPKKGQIKNRTPNEIKIFNCFEILSFKVNKNNNATNTTGAKPMLPKNPPTEAGDDTDEKKFA